MKKTRIAIVGEFQTGKSTLVNLLFGRNVAQVGEGLPCTALATCYHFQQAEVVRIGGDSYEIGAWINSGDVHKQETVVEVGVNNALLLGFDLVDTPGVEAAGKLGKEHEAITFAQVETTDAFILLLDKLPEAGSDSGMGRLITKLRDSGKPTFGFFNCGRLGATKHPKSQASAEIVGAIKARLKDAGFPIPVIADNLKGDYNGFSEESTGFSILQQIEKTLMNSISQQLQILKKSIDSSHAKLEVLINQVTTLEGSQQRMEMGSYQFDPGYKKGKWELGHDSGHGRRKHTIPIKFQTTFLASPNVFLSIRRLDHSRRQEVRFDIEAVDIKKDGFTLCIKTWEDSEVYGAGVCWLAIENIQASVVRIRE